MYSFSPHDLRALAVAAHVDPRTATRWLAGLPVVPAVAHRLAECASQLGLAPVVPMGISTAGALVALGGASNAR